MKEQEIKYIERLLRCFFEGITTNAEEKTLYVFFQGEEIPDHLQEYKSLFEYFSKDMAEELENLENTDLPYERPAGRKTKLWIIVAASFLIAVIGTSVFLHFRNIFNPYEGSYIVRNGERITDLNKIQKELELTVEEVTRKRQEAQELLKQIDESVKKINELEEQLSTYKTELLSSYPNDYVRNEVKEILEMK